MAHYPVFPDLQQYPGSSNVYVADGKAMPAFDHGPMENSADVHHYFIKEAIETTNPDGTPRQYAFANNFAFYHQDGERVLDATFTALNVVQGAAIVEGPPFANNVGTKKLMVTFGDADDETFRLRTLTTDTDPWTAAVNPSTATAATMWKIIALGDGSMIAVTGGGQSGTNIGRTVLGEWHVAKCKRGSDPTVASNWGNVQAVHTPEWPIIDIIAFRDTFAVGKGDGCYVWDDRVKRFRNVLGRVKYSPHALNCKGLTEGENGIWIPLADGRLFFFDGVTTRDQTPYKGMILPRDVMTSRVTAIADRGDIVAARMEAFYNGLAGPRAADKGLKVIAVRNNVATDITANVSDGSLATGGSVATLGAVAGDKLYIGLDMPSEGDTFRVTRAPNTAVNTFADPEASDGSGWTSLGTVVDHTTLGPSNIALALSGYPPAGSSALLSWTNIRAVDVMQPMEVDFGGSVGALTRYWVRFGFATTTGFSAGAEIDEVEPHPSRGGLPNEGILSASNNFSNRSRAGCTGKLMIGQRRGTEVIWNEGYEINDFGGAWSMAWTTGRTGTMTNGGQPLLVWGRRQQTIVAESMTRDPSRTPYPKLVQPGETKPAPTLSFRKLRLGDPKFRKKLTLISLEGQFIQPGDRVSCYAWWDNADKAVLLDTDYGGPAVFRPSPLFQNVGRELNFDLVFSDASQDDPTAPYISRVIVDADDVGGEYDWILDEAFLLPEGL